MRNLLMMFVAATAVCACGSAVAQTTAPTPPHKQNFVAWAEFVGQGTKILEKIKMGRPQWQQYRTIESATWKELKAAHQEYGKNKAEKDEKSEFWHKVFQIRDEYHAKLVGILNAKQQAEFEPQWQEAVSHHLRQ